MHSRKRTRSPASHTGPRKARRSATFHEARSQATHAGQSTEGSANVEDDGTATTQESTIPIPPLLRIPAELAAMVVKPLSPVNLRNFRQTCKWARFHASKRFANESFTHIDVRKGHDSARRLAQVFQGNKGLAREVQTFTVFCGSIYHPRRPCHKDGQDVWTLSGVISRLHALHHLELREIDSQAVACHFWRQHVSINEAHPDQAIYTTPGTNWPQLTTLWIRSAQLTKQDIRLLVRLAGPGLRNLKLSQIKCTDGKWLDILGELPGRSSGLERLELESLSDVTESWEPDIGSLSLRGYKCFTTTNFHKAIRGPKGIEVVVVHQFSAYLTGSQAVQLGLETIIERLAGWTFTSSDYPGLRVSFLPVSHPYVEVNGDMKVVK
ncbi:hypothetical protein LTR17_001621 [Elasticomyces elasticus]|nr:hypothetical protein LTR17_001621 [Elasticomyces elasticus]